MIDITHKSNTLRIAVAQAVVAVSRPKTIEAVMNNTVPKGNVLEMSRAAGLLGIKKTADLLPDCHPMPIESAEVRYDFDGLAIRVEVEVKTVYKTGVEVEAMHGASIVALNIYDMLKPIDKGIEIRTIKLLQKKGGKSDFVDDFRAPLRAAVVVCSDTIAAGKKEDKAGKVIMDKLKQCGVEIVDYTVIPDDADQIQAKANAYCRQKLSLAIFTGGTGLSARDITPEAVIPLLDRQIPGIEEAIRRYGQDRTPYAMLSRSVAGTKDETVILSLPGSTAGARESMDALFPPLLHIFRILKGARH
jgi:molybdenum cofactor biosynthesis protein MoaC